MATSYDIQPLNILSILKYEWISTSVLATICGLSAFNQGHQYHRDESVKKEYVWIETCRPLIEIKETFHIT